jgi:hypothetical protein
LYRKCGFVRVVVPEPLGELLPLVVDAVLGEEGPQHAHVGVGNVAPRLVDAVEERLEQTRKQRHERLHRHHDKNASAY